MKDKFYAYIKNLQDIITSKLEEVDGDVTQLSQQELSIIQEMEAKYADKLKSVHQSTAENTNSTGLLETGFANFVKQMLARDLKERFPQEEEAVRFAFQNKWITPELKDPKFAQKVFEDYTDDISEANQWREEVVGVESDKGLAVGLTWFMVLFQRYLQKVKIISGKISFFPVMISFRDKVYSCVYRLLYCFVGEFVCIQVCWIAKKRLALIRG